MGTHLKAGFTIIETVLVLGVTGALVIGIFMGVGTQINVQRYRDSAESLKSLLQEQYGELTSVRNDRSDTWSCNSAGQTTQSTSQVRGQSDCVMLGRLVTIENTDITSYSIVGYEAGSPTAGLNDIDSLKTNYTLNASTVVIEEDTIEWGSLIAKPVAGPSVTPPSTPRSLSIMFIRSPDSGQIYTFSANAIPNPITPTALRDMVVAGSTVPGQGEQIICVNANNPFLNDELAVYLAPYAVAPSAFEIRSNQYWSELPAGDPQRTIRC